MTIVEFLTARLDEIEKWAKACAVVYPAPWTDYDRGWTAYVMADDPNFHHVVDLDQEQSPDVEWLGDAVVHIARHDPAYVLADVAAKRAIVELHRETLIEHFDVEFGSDPYTALCEVDNDDYPCQTLRLLAQPFADDPDYDRSWAL